MDIEINHISVWVNIPKALKGWDVFDMPIHETHDWPEYTCVEYVISKPEEIPELLEKIKSVCEMRD